MKSINIVLIEPLIHANTGNVARTCAVTGAALHLVKPLGFSIDDRHLKRAGLDYWDKLDITIYENKDEFFEINKDESFYYFSKKGKRSFSEIEYPERAFIVFGREDVGLPDELLEKNEDRCVRIPMVSDVRCLNLSNSVAVAVYEIARQKGYAGLS